MIPSSEYEDGTEFNEGLAKYTECALTYVLEAREPSPAMSWVLGFAGYANLTPQRDVMLQSMRGFLSAESVVNGDPYGTAPMRFRLYRSGMAIGVMLDRIPPDWKERMMEPGTTLTGLVEDAIRPAPIDLAAALGGELSAYGDPRDITCDLPDVTLALHRAVASHDGDAIVFALR